MKKIFFGTVTTILSLLLLSAAGHLVAQKHINLQSKNVRLPSWSWINEPWTGNEQSYNIARAEIEKAVTAKQLTSEIIDRYRMEWEQAKHDPLTLFRWSYACYQAEQMHPPVKTKQLPGLGAFSIAVSPHTYDYSRLRFLSYAESGADPHLIPPWKTSTKAHSKRL